MNGTKRVSDDNEEFAQNKRNITVDHIPSLATTSFLQKDASDSTYVPYSGAFKGSCEIPRAFTLGCGRFIGDGYPCYIIAEIGQNHQGDFEIAKEMIKEAKKCGADCVKFQKSDLSAKFTKSVLARQYGSPHSFGETYGQHKKFLEFSEEQYASLKTYAESLSIHFSASGMDEVSLDFLIKLGVPFLKVGSGDANNFLLLEKAALSQLPIIYSTGMQNMETVQRAMSLMLAINPRICVLQCTSAYPTPDDQVHLKVMATYRQAFPGSPVGYSGHELGLPITLAASALGANVIERHFTLDKSLKGNDHACSLDPVEFKSMVDSIRRIEQSMGVGSKTLQPSEEACHQKLGKSVVSSQPLTAGTRLCASHLKVKVGQPLGWPPQNMDQLIDCVLVRDMEQDEPLTKECIE